MDRTTETEVKRPKLNFKYVAVTSAGRIARGDIKASSEVEAQNLLVARGRTPISIEESAAFWSLERQFPSMYKVKPREIYTFARQLATLLDSGLSLLPAIHLLRVQAKGSRGFSKVLDGVVKDLNAGTLLSDAFSKHPQVFDEIFCRTIGVGESTGSLDVVLRELAGHMEKADAFARKVKGALTYPAIVMTVGILVIFVLLTVVLPPLTDMFTSLDAELPVPTKILMASSDFVNGNIVYILGGAGTFITIFIMYIKRPSGRRKFDMFKMKMPVLGVAVQMAELARMARTMAMLLNSGLALQEIMEIIPKTTTNSVIRDAFENVRQGLVLGQGLSGPMAAQPIFPILFLQMVRVGEETNQLEKNMKVLAEFYEERAAERTAAVVGMIAPISTIVLAAMTGFIALSIIMPMYSINEAF